MSGPAGKPSARRIRLSGTRGWLYYARILAVLQAATEPLSAAQIAQAMGRGATESGVSAALPALYLGDLVHVGGWRCYSRGSPTALFTFGAGEDAIHPGGVAYRRKAHDRRKVFARFLRLWQALQKPRTITDLAETCGMGRSTAAAYIVELRWLRLVRVAEWVRMRRDVRLVVEDEEELGMPVAAYQLGSAPSARRPRRLTSAESSARWVERRRRAEEDVPVRRVISKWRRPPETVAPRSVFDVARALNDGRQEAA